MAVVMCSVGAARAGDAACAPGKAAPPVRLEITVPKTQSIVSMVASLAYDPDRLRLPETGAGPAVRKRVKAEQQGAMMTASNGPGSLRIVAAKAGGLEPGTLAQIRFDRCANAPSEPGAPLRCTVESCAGGGGPVTGCGCTATAP
jgi:hypothetical protein